MSVRATVLLAVILMLAAGLPALADIVTYTGSSGSLAARADFSLTGSTLTVTLTNTSTADVLVPTDVLTGVAFDVSAGSLNPDSASLNGSTVHYGSFVNNVGEGWQYLGGISWHGENSGISATGLGVFGPDGNFFSPGVAVDGLGYGILSAGDDTSTGNNGVKGHGPLIKDSVQFTLTAASGFTLGDLGDTVVFQYGTCLTDTNFQGTVPEPASIALFGIVLAFTARLLGSRTRT